MYVRHYISKNQRSFGFALAWGGALLSVWAIIHPLVWLSDESVRFLLEGIEISAGVAILIVGVIYATHDWVICLRRPKGERRRYPAVAPDQMVDLYLRFMATGAGALLVVPLGLLELREFHLLNSQYALIVLLMGCVAGWIVWIVTRRWLRPYPEN
jgi:hypothetical protein